MQVFVKLPSGSTITIEVESADTIENVKQKIQDKTGVAVEDQTLTFGPTTLANDHTLADYTIRAESTLYLQVQAEVESTTTVVAAAPIPSTGGELGLAGAGLALLVVGAVLVRVVRRPA